MAQNKASMVWSPLSNLLLYGGTADVKSARAAGVPVALGSDWSPSGSKNLLNELKIAKIVNEISQIGLADFQHRRDGDEHTGSDREMGCPDRNHRAVQARRHHRDRGGALERSLCGLDRRQGDRRRAGAGRRTPGHRNQGPHVRLGCRRRDLVLGTDTRVVDYGPNDPKVPPITFADASAALTDALQRLPTLLADEARAGYRRAKPGGRERNPRCAWHSTKST